eukprot:TRINITY_DN88166_c0_g1_i1.p1 TRINITY_DN88166_c0_g1~~TRINITY_DN88166_c0_g1_i1.p1  ORF type:complete len:174 (-),score=38.91 TRINITY_DN88166_c0_g1_i1:69-590(-)
MQQLPPCSPSASSSSSSSSGKRGPASLGQDEQIVPGSLAETTRRHRGVVRTKAEARVELKVMQKQSRFSRGTEYCLASILRDLQQQEDKLLEQLAPPPLLKPLQGLEPEGAASAAAAENPRTPPMQYLLALDPLAHLASPMSPSDGASSDDELSDAEDQELTETGKKRARLSR